jgi:hypothetical protein
MVTSNRKKLRDLEQMRKIEILNIVYEGKMDNAKD